MAGEGRSAEPAKDIFQLLEEQAGPPEEGGASQEAEVIFVGSKGGGKSSLILAFVNKPDVPKPTTALEHKFARYSSKEGGSSTVANIWELAGDTQLAQLLDVVLSPAKLARSQVVIVADLSKPGDALRTVTYWLDAVRARVEACAHELRQSEAGRAALGALEAKLPAPSAEVRPIGVPVTVVGSKCDVFEKECDASTEFPQVMAKTLRFTAHVNGASLVYTRDKDKARARAAAAAHHARRPRASRRRAPCPSPPPLPRGAGAARRDEARHLAARLRPGAAHLHAARVHQADRRARRPRLSAANWPPAGAGGGYRQGAARRGLGAHIPGDRRTAAWAERACSPAPCSRTAPAAAPCVLARLVPSQDPPTALPASRPPARRPPPSVAPAAGALPAERRVAARQRARAQAPRRRLGRIRRGGDRRPARAEAQGALDTRGARKGRGGCGGVRGRRARRGSCAGRSHRPQVMSPARCHRIAINISNT